MQEVNFDLSLAIENTFYMVSVSAEEDELTFVNSRKSDDTLTFKLHEVIIDRVSSRDKTIVFSIGGIPDDMFYTVEFSRVTQARRFRDFQVILTNNNT